MELRTLQDWTVRPILRTAPGVDDVTSWGGFEKQYQVLIDPDRLVKYDLGFKAVIDAIAANNRQVGGQYVNLGAEQYLVRGLGLVANTTDIGNIVVDRAQGNADLRARRRRSEGGAGAALRRGDARTARR